MDCICNKFKKSTFSGLRNRNRGRSPSPADGPTPAVTVDLALGNEAPSHEDTLKRQSASHIGGVIERPKSQVESMLGQSPQSLTTLAENPPSKITSSLADVQSQSEDRLADTNIHSPVHPTASNEVSLSPSNHHTAGNPDVDTMEQNTLVPEVLVGDLELYGAWKVVTRQSSTKGINPPAIKVTGSEDSPDQDIRFDSLPGPAVTTVVDWNRILDLAKPLLTSKEFQLVKERNVDSRSAPQAILKAIQAGEDFVRKSQRKQLRYRGKKVVDVIHPVLKTMQSYGKVVSTAIQHSSETTALVWAGIELIISVGPRPDKRRGSHRLTFE